ncbi:GNAT family N-acetyltransferase [Actinokineospora sp. HUAS TT18]|uniref:GNAT family N-acetyltransferase n=1 Tax=Actinokineospora sp. HUAS TT18 TaxID=3447451 RepID=UPI003F52607C
MEITFARLPDIERGELVALMTDPAVRRHMPLAGAFDAAEFVAAKERIWADHGYGPWAFLADGEFVGWGGPQPEGADVDIALVLRPSAWGLGRRIYPEIIERVFADPGCDSVTALLPPSRGRAAALLRLGFVPDGGVSIGDTPFLRYRLMR